MNISSMTGFARIQGQCEIGENIFSWAFEIKSVNGKNLDFKTKLPSTLEFIAPDLRNIAQKYFERGNISVNLEIKSENNNRDLKINDDLLARLFEISQTFCQKNNIQTPTMGELLNINGIIEIEKKSLTDEQTNELCQNLLIGFEKCCANLQNDRQREGEKIASALHTLLDKITLIVDSIIAKSADLPTRIAQKLKQQIADFCEENISVSEERLAQEIVLLVNRADIREETDRLQAHIKTAKELLASGQAIGRRLDFLCQELNREANTTCSKAADIEIINLGMDLKATIEQFREQVQNME